MARSPLLQLVRDSIEEVIEAKRKIDRESLLKEYPVLEQKIASEVSIKVDNEVRGHASSAEALKPLVDDIIYNAKVAAFQDTKNSPISTAEYLHCSIELSLLIPNEEGGFDIETSTDGPIVKD
ncbi:AMMECR1 domain-containing protein [Sulfurimonas sp. HSL-1716]|uniref:AMMECR1 domain-containing protein n=1 Tax=Hydrocurvibacter sulfurireducens TaxID=3131937 RepID=UPI0031F8AB44